MKSLKWSRCSKDSFWKYRNYQLVCTCAGCTLDNHHANRTLLHHLWQCCDWILLNFKLTSKHGNLVHRYYLYLFPCQGMNKILFERWPSDMAWKTADEAARGSTACAGAPRAQLRWSGFPEPNKVGSGVDIWAPKPVFFLLLYGKNTTQV